MEAYGTSAVARASSVPEVDAGKRHRLGKKSLGDSVNTEEQPWRHSMVASGVQDGEE